MNTKIARSLVSKAFYGIIILIVLLSAFGGGNLESAHAQEISGAAVSLSVDKTSFGAAESVTLHISITNPGSQTIKILKWFTPFSATTEPLFNMSLDGQPVSYLGAIYKRTAPTEADYIVLAPGASMTNDYDLGAYYNLSTTGNYSISYSAISDVLFMNETDGKSLPAFAGSLSSNTLNLFIESHELPQLATAASTQQLFALAASNTFTSCSATRQTDLATARTASSAYLADISAYFNNGQKGARYTTWFGIYDATRYNTVKTHYTNIKNVADTAAINFDCTCTEAGTYAYVYPDQPYNIYLCGAFWSSPTSGTDSRAGTLIHEMSHFTVLGGTDDFVYGQSGSKSLAISNPANAIMNADNHEYFAENNPSLETTNSGTTTYTISGSAGVASAMLSYTDGTAKTATADTNGNYTFTVPSGWSGTVTPSKSGYTFTPASKSYSNVAANQTAQNYVATAVVTTYTISGSAGVASAVLSYTDGSAKTATADANGNYTFTIPSGWSGTVTPSKSGYTFTPASKSYSNVAANQTAQNYVATAVVTTYTISGSAGVASATLSYTDGSAKTATADANGNYTFTIPSGWSGTVTPSKSGYTFTPASKSYSNVAANQTAQNYTATAATSSGANLLLDPSFEAYNTGSPWSQASTNFGTPLCTVTDCGNDGGIAGPRTGTVWSWFGGVTANEDGSLSQSVVFPSGSATLKFYLWIGSAGAGSDSADLVAVKIDGTQVFSANATQASAYPSYTLVSVDVSAFANGASHVVTFSSTTTGQAVTFNVDDVSLIGTDSGGGGTTPTPQTATFNSVSTYDGWNLEYTETSNTGGTLNSTYSYFIMGDNSADKQYRSIVHFNTSSLPDNAVITSATLMIKAIDTVGTNPFNTHGNLLVDIRKLYFGSTASLVNGDFQASSSLQGGSSFNATPTIDNWYSALLGNSSYPYINLTNSTQFRLRFTLDDNDDLGADYMRFYSGNSGTTTARPQLVVQYYVP